MAPLRWIFNRSAESRFGDLAVLVFLLIQALDGVLTYVGIASVGHISEGNPLVAGLMSTMGSEAGLVSAKLWACGLGALLHVSGTHRLLALLAAVYLFAAILPWTAILAATS
jgi:hypothetical protein